MAVLFAVIFAINNMVAQPACSIQQPPSQTGVFRAAFCSVMGLYIPPLRAGNALCVHVPAKTGVYICRSEHAYAYHKYTCRGLSNCRAEVSRVSVSDAQRMGYRPCRICY
ncbi:hypothetical protein C7N43_10355 [Sphingobacteriales bacterium UPWRP_1]|nr:hypothetical protein C7N43_10355 [Sphingobacteriales bacterium UPWRP_1]